ncbi:MAG: transcription termination factor NusA [Eubacteriaceae bacterium]|jgi:N utilization substance protein A|nr:transcription termination factor NusA [Eubacteriaceae bacterium]
MATRKKTEDTSLKDFLDALDEIQRTKGIDKEELISAVEEALMRAYERNSKGAQNARVEIDRATGKIKVFALRTVALEPASEQNEISVAEAKSVDESYEIGDVVEEELDPKGFGRVAAQNAKQLVLQRIKSAERELVFDMYSKKTDELVTGVITKIEKNDVYINIGKAEGVMDHANQVHSEQYFQGMRIKVYVLNVEKTKKDPVIMLSRSTSMLIKRLFELEIPEIFDGSVEIVSIAREAGSRTKISVRTKSPELDAVGTCVGYKGTRILNILRELGNEHIDVVEYSPDPVSYIRNALNPADIAEVVADDSTHAAIVIVDESQLSLAIGKDGQNVRLAAKLTGYKIDIKSHDQYRQYRLSREEGHLASALAAVIEPDSGSNGSEGAMPAFRVFETDAIEEGRSANEAAPLQAPEAEELYEEAPEGAAETESERQEPLLDGFGSGREGEGL